MLNGGGATSYDYDRSSLKSKVSYPNGTQALNSYDRAMRVSAIDNKQNSAIVSAYQYQYDANGNRTQQIETNGGAAETTTYTFDGNDRLTEVAYPGKTTSYSYDAAYNRLTERSLDIASQALLDDKSYHYNSRNQLTSITDHKESAQSVSYTFDANGNQTLKSKNGVITTFLYDVRDQLISVQENATTLGMFYYDYQGMRVAKDMGGQIVRYSYDGKSVLTQSDVNGLTIAKYEYGPDQLLSMQHASEGRQFYLFDALGSVSNLTNTSGMVQARYQYDAFGNLRAEAGSSFNRFTFTGHEKDTETGLYYFKARFYDPDTGRFLNQDPYLGEINTPPSLHRYLYAYANPVVYIDLEGYSASCFSDDAGWCEAQERTAEDEQRYQEQRDAEISALKNSKNQISYFDKDNQERAANTTTLVESEGTAGAEPACGWNPNCYLDKAANTAGELAKQIFVDARMAAAGNRAAVIAGNSGGDADAAADSVRENAERVGDKVKEEATKYSAAAIEGAGGAVVAGTSKAKKAGAAASHLEEVRNGYRYAKDSMGRVTQVEGMLVRNTAQKRSRKSQRGAGGEDRLSDDDGGHFIGRRFNGPTDDINHFAQNKNFNRGQYKALENVWDRELQNGRSVKVQIIPKYQPNSQRPDELLVRYWIDGVLQTPVKFVNRPGGK